MAASQHITTAAAVELLSSAFKEVFGAMVGLPIVCRGVAAAPSTADSTVTAMVGLAGLVTGSLIIVMPGSLSCAVAASMLGMAAGEVPTVNDDVEDAIGEIANMVAGAVKADFSRGGFDISLSPPTVVSGSDYVVNAFRDRDCRFVGFQVGGEQFTVALMLKG